MLQHVRHRELLVAVVQQQRFADLVLLEPQLRQLRERAHELHRCCVGGVAQGGTWVRTKDSTQVLQVTGVVLVSSKVALRKGHRDST